LAFEYAGSIIGAAPYIRKFQIDDTVVAGQWVVSIDGAGTNHGAIGDPAGAETLKDMLGVTNEAGTVSTTKGSSAVEVEVTMNTYGSIWRGPLSGATTVGTAMTVFINDSADTNGLTVTHDQSGYTADYLNAYGALYCVSGANAGQIRKISDGTTTTQVVVQPFDSTIAANDTFLFLATGIPGSVSYLKMTTDWLGVDNTANTDVTSLADEIIVLGYEDLDVTGAEKVLFTWRSAFDQLAIS
jgi:hypothetical protein